MIDINATPNMAIHLGRLGENEHTRVGFNISRRQNPKPQKPERVIKYGG